MLLTRTGYLIVPAATLLLAGCMATPGTTPGTTAATPATDHAETSELAEQTRRDVEQLTRLQQQRAASKTGSDAGDPADHPSGPPRIDWILPTPAGQTTEHATAPTKADRGGIGQGPLAGDPPRTADVGLPLPMPTELPGGSVPTEEPPEAVETDALRQLVVELSAELYRRGAYSDMPLRELLVIAATTMVTPDRALVPDALPGLTAREREIVAHMQDFFRRLGEQLAAAGDPEVLIAAIDELSKSLQKQPGLVLPRAALCSRVGGFGDYDEFPRNEDGRYRFLAHTGQQAVVYVQVEDFTSERNKQGQWVTELAQQLVIISDRDGIPVWQEDWQLGTDSSKNRREDFFIVQIITLPQLLSVGRYQLKIHVRDKRSGAEAESIIEFEMVADPRMTGEN